MKKCSFCGEEINSEAIKCLYCGERLDQKPSIDYSEEQLKNQDELHGQDYSHPHEALKVEQPEDYAIDEVVEIARDGRFIAYDNGTVMDTESGLMWAVRDNGSDINWQDAKRYCENYHGGGYTDWRMPTQDELAGLYDIAKTYKTTKIDIVHLLIRITSLSLWASESAGSDATSFSFYDGRRFQIHDSTALGRVLPVRDYHKECLIKRGGHLAESHEIPKDETSRASTIDLEGHSTTLPLIYTEGTGFHPGSSPKKSTVVTPPLEKKNQEPSRNAKKLHIIVWTLLSLAIICVFLVAVFRGGKSEEVGPLQVDLTDVRQRLVNNMSIGPIRVVEGTAINQSSFPMTRIKVSGNIEDAYKVVLGVRESYCGNLLTDNELATMTEDQIQKELSNLQGSDVSNDRIVSNGQIPFMIVFTHEPAGVVHTVLTPVGAERLLP